MRSSPTFWRRVVLGSLVTALLIADGLLWPMFRETQPELPEWGAGLLFLLAGAAGVPSLVWILYALIDGWGKAIARSHCRGAFRTQRRRTVGHLSPIGTRRAHTTQVVPVKAPHHRRFIRLGPSRLSRTESSGILLRAFTSLHAPRSHGELCRHAERDRHSQLARICNARVNTSVPLRGRVSKRAQDQARGRCASSASEPTHLGPGHAWIVLA